MRVHFIAIGGSAMHNLAIALKIKGYDITGSDDEIFEPSRSRLKKYGILPAAEGWDENNISEDLNAIILGMHAKEDNPELLKAKELGLKIYSYPEYLYEQARDKKRIVIGGSHGKTTITSMILHVLQYYEVACDYMVGAQLEGFEVMVKMSTDAPFMVLEGDEYLTSPLDKRPKFHVYRPDIALISGIAWDHINVFPTFENYLSQFQIFADLISPKGTLIYCSEDIEVKEIGEQTRADIKKLPYGIPEHEIAQGVTNIIYKNKRYPLKVFGEHNLMNLNGARLVCKELGITSKEFYKAIGSFSGASKRLEIVAENRTTTVYKDFAHSPSKLVATTNAVKSQFENRELVACIELHTYSSLSEKFLSHYAGCLDNADIAKVYFNPHTIKLKRLHELSKEQVKEAFNNPKIEVYTDSAQLQDDLLKINWQNKNLLMMSSGNFDGIDFSELGKKVIA
ncbi:MAG: peptidoglycan synthetase [Bacteroidales bacterium]|nr:peptidoglycan synthetase [Bacteroidales bacterium]MCF8404160.1 peptidoglycan synthetase [Bacteroidales bacterium]